MRRDTPWLCVLACLLLAGCFEKDASAKISDAGIYKHMDEETGVACYRYYGYGISCVKVR